MEIKHNLICCSLAVIQGYGIPINMSTIIASQLYPKMAQECSHKPIGKLEPGSDCE